MVCVVITYLFFVGFYFGVPMGSYPSLNSQNASKSVAHSSVTIRAQVIASNVPYIEFPRIGFDQIISGNFGGIATKALANVMAQSLQQSASFIVIKKYSKKLQNFAYYIKYADKSNAFAYGNFISVSQITAHVFVSEKYGVIQDD